MLFADSVAGVAAMIAVYVHDLGARASCVITHVTRNIYGLSSVRCSTNGQTSWVPCMAPLRRLVQGGGLPMM